MAEHFDTIWRNGHFATMRANGEPYGAIADGVLAARDGRIAWIGRAQDFPAAADAERIFDLDGRWVTPGLVDCHTHLVHAGDRAAEYEMRLEGATYEDIAKAGGGIMSTVRATRAADEDGLIAESLPRLDALMCEGMTTVEIKSGYGLTTADEVKMLRAAREIGALRPVSVSTTFLGAHALPPEYEGDADGYIDLVCREMIPAVAEEKLADAVDGFCERIAFSAPQMRRVFEAARALELPVKLHAEQLSDQKGAELVAEFGGLSADHLEYADDHAVAAMAAAGTVAVLLPGAFYFLRETKLPPLAALRERGVAMAVATDCNPGTAPLTSILMALNMATTFFRLTPEEALAGVTRHGARALGLADEIGTIEVGKSCDLAIWDIERPAELSYRIGFNPLYKRVWRGL